MHWEGDLTGSENPKEIVMDGNKSVRAVFGSPITILSNERATFHTAPQFESGALVRNYTDVRVTAVPAPGYYLSAWGGRLAGMPAVPQVFIHNQANAVITGTFEPLPEGAETFTATADHGGEVVLFDYKKAGAPKAFYERGSVVFAHARAANNFVFTGWSGDASGMENPIAITLDGSKRIHASFARGAAVRIVTTDGGTVSRAPEQSVYEPGASVTLTAAPEPGFTFVEWSGGVSSRANPVTVTANGTVEVSARFAAAPWTAAWSRPVSLAPLLAGSANTVFAGSLAAFDSNGALLWEEDPGAGVAFYAQGLAIDPSEQAQLLFYAENPATDEGFSGVLSYSSSGELTGAIDFGADLIAQDLSIGNDGTLFAALELAWAEWGSVLKAVAPDGTLRWEFSVKRSDSWNYYEELRRPAIRRDGSAIFTGAYFNHWLYGKGPGGETLFARQLEFGNRVYTREAIGAGVIDYKGTNFVVNADVILGNDRGFVIDGDGSLLCFDSGGNILWRFKTPDVLNTPSMGADGALYLGSMNSGNVYALNGDGSMRWRSRPGLGGYGVPAVASDGMVYIGDGSALYALGANGAKVKEFRGGARLQDPIIAGSKLYATGLTRLYAFTVAGAANSPWPMRNADARQTAAVRAPVGAVEMSIGASGGGGFAVVVRADPGAQVRIYRGNDPANLRFDYIEIVPANGEVVMPINAGTEAQFFAAQQ